MGMPCVRAAHGWCSRAARYFACCLLAPALLAEDWTQYRGSNHDGTSTESIRTNWSGNPPREIWRVRLGPALSSFTISDGRAYTQVRRSVGGQDQEFCIALNLETGAEIWSRALGIADYPNGGVGDDDGPRSTPVVDGNRVFVFSSYLRLVCLDAASGDQIWSRDFPAEYGAIVIPWENAASPVVESDLVIVNSNARQGQCLMGLHKEDGTIAWKGQNDQMTQSSPVTATLGGRRQVIFFAQSGLVGVAPESGAVLWRYPLRYNGVSVAASPVVAGNLVYCSRAYPGSLSAAQAGAVVIQVTETAGTFSASQVWSKPNQLMNHWATPVVVGGNLYGMYGQGVLLLKCIELSSGRERWSMNGFGYGSVLAVDGRILALADDGQLVLVAANPEAYTELARFRPLNGKCWNTPAVSNGRLYVRSTLEAVSLDVAGALAPLPKLRLAPALSLDAGTFQLFISNEDGSAIDAARLDKIDLLSATDLGIGLAAWTKITNAALWTNGAIRFDDPQSPSIGQRYFRTEERR